MLKKYNIIYADPSWEFKNKNTGGSLISGAANQYNVMSVEDIMHLPIDLIAADDCVLFMWWVASQPENALRVMGSWGFKLKTMTGFTWVKQTKHGKPFFGMGFWTRAGSENCLIAVKGKAKRINASIRSVISAPIEEHSKKPDIFRTRIEQLVGDVPRIELFARTETPGWNVFGDQVKNSINLKAYY
jgi:N6-adenosine-specific RNA methylase IME4